MTRVKAGLAIVCFVVLSACAVSPRNQAPSLTYDFGSPVSMLSQETSGAGVALEVRSPAWFDSLGIDYRLAYDDSLRLREYADSRWAVNPGVLLAQRLRQLLGFPVSAGGSAAECLLRVDLQEFSHVFDSHTASRGILQGELLLIDGKRKQLAARRFLIERIAASPDARGGVGALVSASKELGSLVSDWLAELRAKRGVGFCRAQSGVN